MILARFLEPIYPSLGLNRDLSSYHRGFIGFLA